MSDFKAASDLLNRVFYSQWICSISKVDLSMIKQIPKTLNIVNRQFNFDLGERWNDGVKCTEIHYNEGGLIDDLYGRQRNTTDMHIFMDNEVDVPETVRLSTASIAEIIYLEGEVTLLNPKDIVTIYVDVTAYLDYINQNIVGNLHYKAPPKEDIDAFRALVAIINNKAFEYINDGIGNSAIAYLNSIVQVDNLVAPNLKPTANGLKINGSNRGMDPIYVGSDPLDFSIR